MSTGVSAMFSKQNPTKQPKDLPLCDELLVTVENFKKYLTEQKKLREEIISLSQQPLAKVNDELKSILQQVAEVTSGLQRLSTQTVHLKDDILKEEKHVAIAQRTHETPLSLQFENNAPTEYFHMKLSEFDNKVRLYKQEVDVIEELIASRSRGCLTPHELVDVLRKMDDQFVVLAAQLYTAQEEMKSAKLNYMRNFRAVYGGNRNPFAEIEASKPKDQLLENDSTALSTFGLKSSKVTRTPYGPSPFATTTTSSVPGLNPAAGSQNLLSATGTAQLPSTMGNLFGATSKIQPTATSGFGLLSSQPIASGGIFGTTATATPQSAGLSLPVSTTSSFLQPAFGFGTSTISGLGTLGSGSLFGQPTSVSSTNSPFRLTTATTTTAANPFGLSLSGTATPFGFGAQSGTTGNGLFGKRTAN